MSCIPWPEPMPWPSSAAFVQRIGSRASAFDVPQVFYPPSSSPRITIAICARCRKMRIAVDGVLLCSKCPGVMIGEARIKLTPIGKRVLAVLLLRRPREVLRKELLELAWPDPDTSPLDIENNLKAQIHRIRKAGFRLETRFNFGWRLI